MIEQYLDSMRRQLPGPRAVRHELLRELGDGLRDAASVYQMQGMSRQQAERRAAEESGDPTELAPHYREALAVAQGRRTAALYALTTPASILAWSYVWADPDAQSYQQAGAQSPLAMICWKLIDYAGVIVGLAAVAGLLLLILANRRGRSCRAVMLLPAVAGIGHVTITMVCSTVGNLAAGGGLFGEVTRLSPLLTLLCVASVLTAVWQGSSSVRTIRMSRLAGH